jgi:uncharacterized protein YbjT (DUF2867 family)
MNDRTLTVFGATGAQGAPVVQEALAAGWRVRAVARDAASVRSRYGDAVEAYAADLEQPQQVAAALRGVQAAFVHLPLPSDGQAPQRQLATFIQAAHGERLPLTIYTTSGPTGARFGSSPIAMGNAAAAAALLSSGLRVVVLQPTVYLDNLRSPLGARLHRDGVMDYPPLAATRRLSWTTHADQARLAVAALDRPGLVGQAVDIASGKALSGPEAATLLGTWIGRPVVYQPATVDDFARDLGHSLGSAEMGAVVADLYRQLDAQPADAAVVDTAALEAQFGIRLPSLAEQVAGWPRP